MAKQVIVMRTDLDMNKGKMVPQGAHATMKVFFDMMVKENKFKYVLQLPEDNIGEAMSEWIDTIFTKIACEAKSEEELLAIYNKAKNAGLPCSLIQDIGKTVFKGVPTYTCCAVGPASEDEVNKITGHLPLLKY